MFLTAKDGNQNFLHKCRKFISELGLFLILLFLPTLSIWVSFYFIQKNLVEDSINDSLDEMSEITAHMLRKTEPETYYQESLRRLSESFKWVETLDEVSRIENKDLLDLALFDENGVRLKWPANENLIKTKFSQDYLKALKRFSVTPGATPTSEERKAAIGYSGNEMTLTTIAGSPNTLISFQGVGLRKMGGWFKVQFNPQNYEGEKVYGDLIAWLNLEKLDKHTLAERTIKAMQKLTKADYTFSFIDLNNPNINKSSLNRKFKPEIAKLLSSNSLKSNFVYKDELFAISDTQEGIRLICSRPIQKNIHLLNNYNRCLMLFLPVVILFFIWKVLFKVKFNFSIRTQAILIFGFASIVGFISIFIGTIAYQYEKDDTTTQKFKQEAIEILEKVDQQYTDSFDDLLFQYRHFTKELANSNKTPEEILAPLQKARMEDVIAYAVYLDDFGNIIFQEPSSTKSGKYSSIADRYSKIVNRVAAQSLKTYNSSKSKIPLDQDPASIRVITANAVDGLLSGRSKFIDIKFDSEDTLAFMDFALEENDYAKGCLLIIHEPRKLERNYLKETGRNISKTKNYELIAFPKTVSNQNSYYPRYSYIFEEPLWKLNDTVNLNKIPGFKKGNIGGKNVIVAAISANNMRNYNLFLSMPLENIGDKAFSLSKVLLIGTAISLFFMLIISLLLISSISAPIKILRKNVASMKNKEPINIVNFSDSSELDNISTGLTNLVIKTRGFYENDNICMNLLPFMPYEYGNFEVDQFSTQIDKNIVLYSSKLEENLLFTFLISLNGKDSLDSTIQLSMANMAMKIFVEQQGMRNPSSCITNLEEFFRINYRKDFEGSIIAMLLDSDKNELKYSGFGQINLLKYNHATLQTEIVELPSKEKYFSNINETGDIINEIPDDYYFIAIAEAYSEEKLLQLKSELENERMLKLSSKSELEKIIKNISKKDLEAKSVLFIHRKAENKIAQIKKLAENNPIALIRSQKNRRPADA